MAVTSLPQAPSPLSGIPSLGSQIEHLLELRDLIRRAQAEERQLTAEILQVLVGGEVAS